MDCKMDKKQEEARQQILDLVADYCASVLRSGPFPKKSFSIGLGADKRYYLECRKL